MNLPLVIRLLKVNIYDKKIIVREDLICWVTLSLGFSHFWTSFEQKHKQYFCSRLSFQGYLYKNNLGKKRVSPSGADLFTGQRNKNDIFFYGKDWAGFPAAPYIKLWFSNPRVSFLELNLLHSQRAPSLHVVTLWGLGLRKPVEKYHSGYWYCCE